MGLIHKNINLAEVLFDENSKFSSLADILGLNKAFINQYRNNIVYLARISLKITFITDLLIFLTFFIIYYVPDLYGPNNTFYVLNLNLDETQVPKVPSYNFALIFRNTRIFYYVQTAYYGLNLCCIGSISNQHINYLVKVNVKKYVKEQKQQKQQKQQFMINYDNIEINDDNDHDESDIDHTRVISDKKEKELISDIIPEMSLCCLTGKQELGINKDNCKQLKCMCCKDKMNVNVITRPKSVTKMVYFQWIFAIICFISFIINDCWANNLVGEEWQRIQDNNLQINIFSWIYACCIWSLNMYFCCGAVYNFIILNTTIYHAVKSIEKLMDDVDFVGYENCQNWWEKREKLINEKIPSRLTYSVLSITSSFIGIIFFGYVVLMRAFVVGVDDDLLASTTYLNTVFCMFAKCEIAYYTSVFLVLIFCCSVSDTFFVFLFCIFC